MYASEESATSKSASIDAARVAIWRLFQQGFVDEDMATAGLLAVDLGTRRMQRGNSQDQSTKPLIGVDDSSRYSD